MATYPATPPASQFVCQSFRHVVSWAVASQSLSDSFCQLFGQSAFSWSDSWLVGSASKSVSHPVSQSGSQSVSQSVS